jgi:four helix bundle protein
MEVNMEKRNEIFELSFDFALKIIAYSEVLEDNRKYVIARQLLKSGTSIGSNIKEAQNANRRKDFVAKCIIAMKEADETEYWLLLCQRSKYYADPETLLPEILSLKKILSKIISSTIKNLKS